MGSGDALHGRVLHVSPVTHRVAVYIKVGGGWWTKPTFAQPVASIQSDGTWSAAIVTGGIDQLATNIAAFLIPSSYDPPPSSGAGALPDGLAANAVAQVQVQRSQNSISGAVIDRANRPVSGVTVDGGILGTAMTAPNGKYSFFNLPAAGAVMLTPSHPSFVFAPPVAALNISNSNQPANFSAGSAVNDFNRNGVLDLVWQEDATRAPGVWYMSGSDGSTVRSAKMLSGPAPGWRITGDLDGNGRPDLIWQDSTRAPGVWYMGGSDGSTVLGAKMLGGPAPGWSIVGIGDLDSNGHPDLVWQEDSTSAPGVWYMGGSDGSILLIGKMLGGPAHGWRIVGVGDLDSNGHPDLVWQEEASRAPGAWYMGGNDGSTVLNTKMLRGPAPGWAIVGPR